MSSEICRTGLRNDVERLNFQLHAAVICRTLTEFTRTRSTLVSMRVETLVLLFQSLLHLSRRRQRTGNKLRFEIKATLHIARVNRERIDLSGKPRNQIVVADDIENVIAVRQIRPPCQAFNF